MKFTREVYIRAEPGKEKRVQAMQLCNQSQGLCIRMCRAYQLHY